MITEQQRKELDEFYAKDAESWAFESFCRVHPHEAFETWPERFWEFFHREHPNITREQMEALLLAGELQ